MYSQIKIKSVRNGGSGPYHWKQAETNGISKEHYNHSEGKKERKSGIGRRETERKDILIYMIDPRCGMAETNTKL